MISIILKKTDVLRNKIYVKYSMERKNILIHFEALSQTLNPQLPNHPPYCHIHCYYSCVTLRMITILFSKFIESF